MDDHSQACPSPIVLDVACAGYNDALIINDVSFRMRQGTILGLLGANGSGKSTLLRAITGQFPLASGTVEIEGVDLAREPVRAKAAFGLAVDVADLPLSLTGSQYLELMASIRKCSLDDRPCRDLLACLGMNKWLGRRIAEYSLGTRAKISIAAALFGSPPLLIFDESLNGLDPVAAWDVKESIKEMATGGRRAIIVSTHVVDAVPALCTEALFLAKGRIAKFWDQESRVGAPPAFQGTPWKAGRRHENWGIFSRHIWGVYVRHSHFVKPLGLRPAAPSSSLRRRRG
ncbi:ABC transporter ATP-binding protein [Methylocystis sp. IM4]|uniref:ABC transporter ATP-binding protein n=1 Tax=Methylocystis sp. IM4 TaxID=3136560 RepID=UPI00311A3DF6